MPTSAVILAFPGVLSQGQTLSPGLLWGHASILKSQKQLVRVLQGCSHGWNHHGMGEGASVSPYTIFLLLT